MTAPERNDPMTRTIPTPEPARRAVPTDAAAVSADTTPDASPTTAAAIASPIPAPDDPTTTPDPITPDADALADRLAAAVMRAIAETDPITTTTPDGPAADAIAAARSMGRHAVRRERVLTDAIMAAIGDDPTTAPAAVAVVGAIRAALAAASATPDPVDPIALTADRVVMLATLAAALMTADPAPLADAPAWARTIADTIPDADADRPAFRAAVADRLAAIGADDPARFVASAASGLADADRLPVPAWGSARTTTRGSGGDPIAYAVAALPIAWESRDAGAVVIRPTAAARVVGCYADGGYGQPGATARPSGGAVRNAVHDGRVPGWRLVTRPGATDADRAAWGIVPDADPIPAGWIAAPPRDRGTDADPGADADA